MLERLNDLPAGIDGLKATGSVSKTDYDEVFVPLVDEARKDGRRMRFLFEFGAGFDGFTPSAMWEDAKLGLRSMRLFDGCAMVTDRDWIRESVRLVAFVLPCPVHVYATGDRGKAIAWLGSLPEGAGVSHRLLAETGVLVVEVTQALRVQDFDALALTADTWIEAHGDLHGLVIHARAFPGWENLAGLLRHLRFVRNHHRKIKKIALAVDVELAQLAADIGSHFIKAEVKTFTYGDLEPAIAWAGGGTSRVAATPTDGAPLGQPARRGL